MPDRLDDYCNRHFPDVIYQVDLYIVSRGRPVNGYAETGSVLTGCDATGQENHRKYGEERITK